MKNESGFESIFDFSETTIKTNMCDECDCFCDCYECVKAPDDGCDCDGER